MTQTPQSRSSGALLWLAIIPIMVVSVVAWKILGSQGGDGEIDKMEQSAFDLAQAPEADRPPPIPVARTPKREWQKPDWQRSWEAHKRRSTDRRRPSRGRSRKERWASQREREKAFIKRYDHLIKREQKRMGRITHKFFRKHAKVRKVDRAFGRLPRYMALVRQYDKDRDAYKWARNATKLPEVRRLMIKFSRDPEVWSLAVQMMDEALKRKPPRVIHDEMVRFFTEDKYMKNFVHTFADKVMPQVPKMVMNLPAGVDMSPMQKLAEQLTPDMQPGGGTARRGRRR